MVINSINYNNYLPDRSAVEHSTVSLNGVVNIKREDHAKDAATVHRMQALHWCVCLGLHSGCCHSSCTISSL